MVAALQRATDGELRIMEAALLRVTSKAASKRRRPQRRAVSAADRAAWFESHLSAFEDFSAQMLAAQQPLWEALEAEVLANLKQHGGQFASKAGEEFEVLLFAVDALAVTLSDAFRPIYFDAYEQLGQSALDLTRGSGMSFDLENPRAQALLKERDLLMKTVAQDAQDRCRSALAEGIANGETIDQLTDRVTEWAQTGREGYAENVARTETGSALNAGAKEGMVQAECTHKTWLAVVDDRSRPDHADLDGVTIPIDEQFDLDSGSYDGPHDPAMGPGDVCQCRCTVVGGWAEEGAE